MPQVSKLPVSPVLRLLNGMADENLHLPDTT